MRLRLWLVAAIVGGLLDRCLHNVALGCMGGVAAINLDETASALGLLEYVALLVVASFVSVMAVASGRTSAPTSSSEYICGAEAFPSREGLA